MEINKEKTVSFTGYRTHKILRSTNEPDIIERLSEELEQTINTLIDQGYTVFLSGMAEGFDMLAAEAVLRIRMKRPDIKLIAVVPFQGQDYEQVGFTNRSTFSRTFKQFTGISPVDFQKNRGAES